MIDRIIGVFKLDAATFEEIEADESATGQAALVVLIVSLISALGAGFFGEGSFGGAFIGQLLSSFFGWIVWSAITLAVGTALFNGKSDMGEMLRVLGFAQAPLVLAVVPCLGWVVGAIWALIAGFVAVRQGLDLDNVRAFLTILVGFVAYVVLAIIIGIFFGGMAAIGSIFG